MALEYRGGVPDWCGEAANRNRLEGWYAGFGAEGIPCPVCRTRKLSADFRRLAHELRDSDLDKNGSGDAL